MNHFEHKTSHLDANRVYKIIPSTPPSVISEKVQVTATYSDPPNYCRQDRGAKRHPAIDSKSCKLLHTSHRKCSSTCSARSVL
ncbi:hypothetical protein BGZ60DRAFT_422373 [Tricladium varicosporioides]|nr:hypothetical protein BGZ60DRAFT_422373 [Hymenoscyphus varicosporioides]